MLAVLEAEASVVAPGLLGWVLCRRFDDGVIVRGRIVETEAYVGVADAASHVFGGRRTARNEAMYGRAGTAYVYFTYGMHWCLNVVCASEGEPQAVLVRAIEPVEGAERMEANRLSNSRAARSLPLAKIGAGPARVCAALGLDRAWNGVDLLAPSEAGGASEALWLEAGRMRGTVVAGPRIGIDRAGEPWVSRPLRFGEAGSRSLSRRFA